MFRHRPISGSPLSKGFETLELIFHAAVRNLRKSNGNAVLGLVMSIIQSLIMVLIRALRSICVSACLYIFTKFRKLISCGKILSQNCRPIKNISG